jgi:hypothetical protein
MSPLGEAGRGFIRLFPPSLLGRAGERLFSILGRDGERLFLFGEAG